MSLPRLENVLIRLDEAPFAWMIRALAGYLIVPFWSRVAGDGRREWTLILFFAGFLVALRIVPALARRVLPFSSRAQEIWESRRSLAKRSDSYQWQKLLWFGLGLGVYAMVSGQPSPVVVGLAAVCALSGAGGLVRWRMAASAGGQA